MKSFIKPAIYLIIAIAAVCAAYHYWFKPGPVETTQRRYQDTLVAPTNEFNVKPRSTPFESKKPPLVRIPEGIPEKSISKAIRIIKTDSTGRADTTGIILTEDGQVLVDNQAGNIKQVDIGNYVPPILDWGFHTQVGITIWNRVSPAIGIAPLEVEGCVQLPLLTADFYGVGLGAAYHRDRYSIGLISHWGFLLERQIKITLTYNL